MLLSASMCYSVAILVYSENARLRAAADMHQTLLQTGGEKKNAMKTSKILKVAFGEQKIEKFFSGFPSSTEAYLCQRHQMLRLSNNKETR